MFKVSQIVSCKYISSRKYRGKLKKLFFKKWYQQRVLKHIIKYKG